VSTQRPLQFDPPPLNQTFNSFFSGNNEENICHLKQFLVSNDRQIFLSGETGTGKTHLLQASCQYASEQDKSCFYFSFKTRPFPKLDLLDGLETFDLICFDDIENMATKKEWEQGFFHLYNRNQDAHQRLLLAANCPPNALKLQLPDLKTRMAWGLSLKLNSLTEEQQLQALIYKAKALGFDMPSKVGKFLIVHYAHDLTSVWNILGQIEYATLAAKRKISIPFLKQIMQQQAE